MAGYMQKVPMHRLILTGPKCLMDILDQIRSCFFSSADMVSGAYQIGTAWRPSVRRRRRCRRRPSSSTICLNAISSYSFQSIQTKFYSKLGPI